MTFKITLECEEYYGNTKYTNIVYVCGESFADALNYFIQQIQNDTDSKITICSIKIEYSDIIILNK